jgi:hypothetical protein
VGRDVHRSPGSFTLTASDRRLVPKTSSAVNRLGFALQLGTLRYLGFCPKDIGNAPQRVVAFIAVCLSG